MKLYAWAVLIVGLGLLAGGGGDGVLGQSPPAPPPPVVELKQNYPNPFNPATTIPFALVDVRQREPAVAVLLQRVLGRQGPE